MKQIQIKMLLVLVIEYRTDSQSVTKGDNKVKWIQIKM